jgi:hypothetical protein
MSPARVPEAETGPGPGVEAEAESGAKAEAEAETGPEADTETWIGCPVALVHTVCHGRNTSTSDHEPEGAAGDPRQTQRQMRRRTRSQRRGRRRRQRQARRPRHRQRLDFQGPRHRPTPWAPAATLRPRTTGAPGLRRETEAERPEIGTEADAEAEAGTEAEAERDRDRDIGGDRDGDMDSMSRATGPHCGPVARLFNLLPLAQRGRERRC